MDSFWTEYKTILFDLDGTLINSAKDLTDALNDVLVTRNIPIVPFEVARPYAGIGSMAMIDCAFNYHKLPELSLEGKEKLRADFMEAYAKRVLTSTSPFEGAEALLDMLNKRGISLILATNKPRRFTEIIIAHLGWDKYFKAIACPDDVSKRKPDPAHLQDATKMAKVTLDNALMVGDTIADYEAAKGCNIHIAMVDFIGYDMKRFPEANYIIKSYL